MPTPTVTHPTTRPVLGLTGKGRAAALLLRVRDQWERLTPEQQAECAELLDRLQMAMRREEITQSARISRPLPLVGRLFA